MPSFEIPIVEKKGSPSLDMNITEVTHSFSNELPAEVADILPLKGWTITGETLILPCQNEDQFLGLLKITGVKETVFSEDAKNFVDTLRQSLIISLESISFHEKLIISKNQLEQTNQDLTQRIKEQRLTEVALRESEGRFRSLTASAPIGISLLDAQGNCIYTNSRWNEIMTMSETESLGENWDNAIHPDDRDFFVKGMQLDTEHEFYGDVRILTPDQQERWGQIQSVSILSEGGKLEGYVSTLEDITERRQAEDTIREKTRMEEELKTASAVQEHLFPKSLPQIENIEIASFFQSAFGNQVGIGTGS